MTAQIKERCLYQGQSYDMPGCISLPLSDGRVIELTDDALKEAIDADDFCFSTACWRQYVGVWEVEGDGLYLKSLEGMYRMAGDQSVFADWFSDTLCLPYGELLDFDFEIEFMHYTQELRLTFEKGVLVNKIIVDTEQ
ncbi:hypothetical protein L3V77_09415 [Vibrio sp. DW001]|uniref:hypothetical protein n=1 Tax=Vibrio sp. DW001 TaxID=2912315 RepID=UPI0023B0D99D|nr:hypothetical protein [Vibrio sp. DW001]WED25293.1 hypothetical protein L3V77_09415 [Vibrio sp. DW001]